MLVKIIITAMICGLFGAIAFYILARVFENIFDLVFIADIFKCIAALCMAIAAVALFNAAFLGLLAVLKIVWAW